MNNSTVYEPILIPDYIAYTSLFLCSIVLAVGLLGNMMVIIVILTSKVLRSSTNLFLLNLSVADMLVLAICTPSTLVDVATRRADVWVMGKAMCYLTPFMELSVSHTSILTILAITVERYYAICLPLQANLVCTKSKACITCFVVWLCAFGLTAPILAMIEYEPGSSQENATNTEVKDPGCWTQVEHYWQKFYMVFIIIVFFFIPLLVLVLLYIKIARNLVPTVEGDEQVMAESSNVLRSRKQVVSMLATVVVFFFACMMPFKIFVLWIITLQVDVTQVISLETYHLLLYFCRVMFYINSAINPILYNIMSSKFREGFRTVFHCVEWPLTPQRLRLTGHGPTSSNPGGIRRKTTVSSSLQVVTSSRQMVSSPAMIERCPKIPASPALETDEVREEEGEETPKGQKQQRSSFSQHCRHEKNIVFIEERKILVIPATNAKTTDI